MGPRLGSATAGKMDSTHSSTDCRTEEGIVVALIDGVIATARIIREKGNDSESVREALKDLRSDEDIAWLFDSANTKVCDRTEDGSRH